MVTLDTLGTRLSGFIMFMKMEPTGIEPVTSRV